MEQWNPVHLGKDVVGKVSLKRQGLYYSIHCRCRVDGGVIHRLIASCSDKREDLGVVVPIEGGFGLNTKIPVKRLGEGAVSFLLLPKHRREEGKLISVYPDEPFAYLAKLKQAYLVKREGQTYICIK